MLTFSFRFQYVPSNSFPPCLYSPTHLAIFSITPQLSHSNRVRNRGIREGKEVQETGKWEIGVQIISLPFTTTAPHPPRDADHLYYVNFFRENKNDHLGLLLVIKSLNDDNYPTWKCSMIIAFTTKNKIAFVNGSFETPLQANKPTDFAFWERYWDDLTSYKGTPSCSCDGIKEYNKFKEHDQIMQFLMGLNDSYNVATVKTQKAESFHCHSGNQTNFRGTPTSN
ncbi:hypothetical protein SADUNF_Sadunf17G0061700 [Salix dunnii]|uniref:Retrotransposon Copia-like N-terminal domain-containing protein n=1 Tax=Salix dunnii TaxID=1413687 RepID=A0A835J4T2_9ROSI|nr:hypothetical protein SADUNF_Sadunf17G0061700 [Salix dunnii]